MMKLAVLLLLLLQAILPAAAQSAPPTILLIESYHAEFEWDASYRAALQAKLEPAYKLVSFEMDTKRLPPERHAAMADQAWALYLKLKPALVIVGDDAALSMLVTRLAATTTPVVYLGINNNPRNYFDPGKVRNITGVLERPLVKRNVAQLRKIMPKARRVLFLFDTSMTSTVILGEIFQGRTQQQFEGLTVDIKLIGDWRQWQDEVLAARSNGYDALFYGTYQAVRDGAKPPRTPISMLRWSSEHAQVPLFGLWDFFVGADLAAGGLVLDGREQGMEAAAIALRILGGAAPGSIYPVTAQRGRFVFSRTQLQRFGITLPPEIAAQSQLVD
ncbi:sugar ABC transporter [Pseudoduganella sp. FT55W]|uniref:Sugar ABC transporter n=1 Tax=Duganella rivi TaxID=2666083 RepID=A0A7X4GSB2_9BURK|nr:ABC transporter substrate binding protein [Duganella rivi]MYM68775.1 sugar ABC transporter [Duganella rivi]